jgi:tetratricopeptide (TPR) repeat protein
MPLLSYSPSHTEIPVLERLTTGAARHRLIETLVEAVRAEVGREAHQHQLLIGSRGSGKTHALTLVGNRLRTDPELQSCVLPIVLAEEEVASHPADLMRKVLEKLAATLEAQQGLTGRDAALRESRATLAALRSERDDEQALGMAVGTLEAASSSLGRLLVLVIENLDMLFYAGQSLSRRTAVEGQWGLRRALLEARGLLVLGAAPSLFGEVTNPNAPFYDFFRLHHLSELSPEEMLSLIRSRLELERENEALDITRKKRLQALDENFDARTPKLRGLLVLTGGLPRFAHLIFDLLAETDISSVAATISRFLDEQTPYFQSRLDPRLIPEAELEILDTLASAPGPLTPKEIAGELRGKAPNAVAMFLKRLRERGLVRQVGPSRKDTRYDLTEPLFRVWRRFRLGRTEREQVVILAQFVAAMFERKELETEWQGLAEITTGELRRSVVESALRLKGWDPPEKARPHALVQEAEHEYMTGSLLKASEIYDQTVAIAREESPKKKGLIFLLNRSAHIKLLIGAPSKAMQLSTEAEQLATDLDDDLGRAHAIRNRGQVLFRLGDNQQALQAFHNADELYEKMGDDCGRANAIRNRGEVLVVLGDNQQALKAFHSAEELYRKVDDDLGRANAIRNRGEVLFRLGDSQQAVNAFRSAEELYRKVNDDLGLGGFHFENGRLAWAQEDWSKWLDHLLTAHQLALRLGHRFNTELAAEEVWKGLSKLAARVEPESFRRLLRSIQPLLRTAATEEAARDGLVRFALTLLAGPGPGFLLDVLPVLEGELPETQATILRPVRLAAEIQSGRRLKELAEEPEEMRRAVNEVLRWIEKNPKKTAGSRRDRAKRGRKKES